MLAPILAFAGVAAVQAGPLYQRQVSSAVSSVAEAPSSVASAVSSVVESATSAASSAVESGSSAVSSGVESGSSMASSMMTSASSAASSGATAAISGTNATTGNQSYPLYPCPTGYLLTYVQTNQTVPVSVTQVTEQFGSWANSSYFPNVTASEGGNDVGATHTINLQGVDLIETLVNATMSEDSGAAMWTWNLTNGPVSAMGVSISNYSTVLSIYDPTYEQTNTIGNETTLLTFTNFCASSQAEGMTLVSALANLELGSFAARLGGSAAGGSPSGAMSTGMMASSTGMMATSSVASDASMATSSAASGASMATSAAASGASSAASAASSGAAGVTSSVAGAVSSAVSAALPSSSA